MITPGKLRLLEQIYPTISAGRRDVRERRWSDFEKASDNFAYEIGRRLEIQPPVEKLSMLFLDADIERMILELGDFRG